MSAGDGKSGTGGGGERDPHEPISALEWAVAALGLLLVLGAVAIVVEDALRNGIRGPVVAVQADSVLAMPGGGYRLHFTARNGGRGTAAELVVTGVLRDGAGEETSQATVDYLPARSTRRGGLFFTRDPRTAALQLRAEGYREP